MNFRVNALVMLLFAAVCTLAENSAKPAQPEHVAKAGDDLQPTPTSTPGPTAKPTPTTAPTTPSPPPTTTTSPSTVPTPPPTKPAPPPTTPSTPAPTTPPTTPPATPAPTTPPTTPVPTTPPTTPVPTTPPTTPVPTTPSTPPDSWIVYGDNNTVCIIAQMALKVTVPYPTKENKTVDADFHIQKAADASAKGTCGPLNQALVLTFLKDCIFTLNFSRNATSSLYSLKGIDLTISVNNETFPNISSELNVSAISLKTEAQVFSVATNYSYTCSAVNPIGLTGTVKNVTLSGTLVLSGVHVEAFGTGKDPRYSASKDCASTTTPDIVPIAVGLILAGLVIVVLVAYLVGRRRAQARGYLSM